MFHYRGFIGIVPLGWSTFTMRLSVYAQNTVVPAFLPSNLSLAETVSLCQSNVYSEARLVPGTAGSPRFGHAG